MIYLDNNASTRVFERVVDAMDQFLSARYANPGSAFGRENGLDQVVNRAKATIGTALGADDPDQWILTSGATEANNLAILGAAAASPDRRHLVLSAIEHPSVAEPAEHLRRRGYDVTTVPVDRNGLSAPAAVAAAVRADTLLVAVMTANNETGVVQPVEAIAGAVKQVNAQVLFLTDATQAIGKIEFDLAGRHSAVDLLSFSAHKCHGPKGVGGLFARQPARLAPILYGGGQQAGLRPGTENPAGAVGAATAIEMVMLRAVHYAAIARLRDTVEAQVLKLYPHSFVAGSGAPRLPTTSYVCLPGTSAAELADKLADRDIAVSAGSSWAHTGPSRVALAMGLNPEQARGCLRISLSLETTLEEIEEFATALAHCIGHRHTAPLAGTSR